MSENFEEWIREHPKKKGYYWLFERKADMKPRLFFCKKFNDGTFPTICGGKYVFEDSYADKDIFFFKNADVPELPETLEGMEGILE